MKKKISKMILRKYWTEMCSMLNSTIFDCFIMNRMQIYYGLSIPMELCSVFISIHYFHLMHDKACFHESLGSYICQFSGYLNTIYCKKHEIKKRNSFVMTLIHCFLCFIFTFLFTSWNVLIFYNDEFAVTQRTKRF